MGSADVRDRDAQAQEHFERLRERYPNDPLVALYCTRLADNEPGDRILLSAK